jgi:hypothetical protein
VPRNVPH